MLWAIFASVAFLFASFFYCTIGILTWPISPSGKLYHWWIKMWARTVIAMARIKMTVEGQENVDSTKTYVVMSNHRSNFDVATLFCSVPLDVVMVAKRSLGMIPILGWGLRLAGYIFIDRTNRQAAVATLHRAAERLRGGQSIHIFPEGTRSFDSSLLPFKKGGFVMAIETGLPILPVGIQGTEHILRKDSALLFSGPATVRIGKPIDTAPYKDKPNGKEELLERVQKEIASLCNAQLPSQTAHDGDDHH
jgi:1-acyl-sn-glycerol-3-phosphate acyltransferase